MQNYLILLMPKRHIFEVPPLAEWSLSKLGISRTQPDLQRLHLQAADSSDRMQFRTFPYATEDGA